MLLFTATDAVPLVAEHVGASHTAYKVTSLPVLMFLIDAPAAYLAVVAFWLSDQPLNTFAVLYNVLRVAAVHAES